MISLVEYAQFIIISYIDKLFKRMQSGENNDEEYDK
jgi:hypothetical protein